MEEIKRRLIENNVDLNDIDENTLTFLYESVIAKKGYIFVYHQSEYDQNYTFDLKPNLIVSLKQFEKMQNVFVFDVDYKVIPLLLSDGHFYKKLTNITNLSISKPLLSTEEDIDILISLCRKKEYKNIWVMHPRGYSSLMETIKTKIPDEDEVYTLVDPISFDHKNIHVVLLLMSEGNHYRDLLKQIPAGVSVSKILPLEEKIKEWIEAREE